ncbi:MAG: hypothetical protein EBX70_09125, partial [Betaproteobacteria bacterium]|nr:hypothetical protein [Betaproteobacteria bacterium]
MNICHGKHQSKRCGFAFCGFAFRHALVTLCLLQTLISAQLAGAQVRGESLEIRSTSLQQTAASLTGFQAPLQSTPFSLSLIDTQTASDFGLHALSDLLRSDPAVSDAYNTIGYPENFAIRGFLIDPRLNYRRDGLPINGHVPLAFENKASVLLLKGASGMFAGSASPGGLVDFVLKRPGNLSIRSATLSLSERGTRYVAADLSERFGASQSVGIRINLANETRRPMACL